MICISKYDAGTNYEWHNTLYLLYPAININYVWLIANIPLNTVIFFTICAILYIIFCTFLCMYAWGCVRMCACMYICTCIYYMFLYIWGSLLCYGGGGVW